MMWEVALALLLPAAVQAAADDPELVHGSGIERHLARGDEHRFRLTVAAGDATGIVVEQRGIDVRITIRDATGTLVDLEDDAHGPKGEERFDLVAAATGTVTVSIQAAPGASAAGDYRLWISEPHPATDADRHVQESHTLRARGIDVERRGQYTQARAFFERSVELAEAEYGPDDVRLAPLLVELGGNALDLSDNARARALYERATAIADKTLGASNPLAAISRSRLALLDQRAGQQQKAETGVRDALPVLERTVGTDHPWYLITTVTLANLRESAGDLQQAEALDRRALASIERTGQSGTLLEATILNNLADVLRTKGDDAAALPMFERSLAIAESVLTEDSLFVATALQNLGIMARQRKDYKAGIGYYTRALAMRERILGPNHPTLAGVLVNLGNLYRAMGEDSQALENQFRALRLWEADVGTYARETLLVVGNIARTFAGMGDVEHALAYQRRADGILETQMELYLATGSERAKLAFVRSQAERTDRTISLHLRQAPENQDAATLAALVLLQRKGRVQDAMTDLFASVRQRVTDAGDRALLDQLKETTTQLARLALGDASAREGRESVAALEALEARKEKLEAALSEHSAEFRAQIQPVTLERVQAAIPADAALIELAVFRPFDPGAERNEEAYGPPHYAAYVITKHSVPLGVDLGAVEDIDKLVVRMRNAVRDPSAADVKARARAVDERIMQPIHASLTGVTRLLISPDGGLNLVPFEALVDEHGRFLIERYTTTYLTSGRDLLRMDTPRATKASPIIIADPLFGEPSPQASRLMQVRATSIQRSVTVGADMSTLYFAPLAGSAMEGRAIKELLPDARLLTGRRASKSAIESVSAPSILHIASHGFFLADDSGAALPALVQNPLLRSGLALAGANLPDGARGDGILTALEAAGLDLWGTHLVTLSACDTGVGEVHNGEGVYGLRRAFMLAGAETLVMSLWPVTDSIARDTMVAYYLRLRSGVGRGDALRQAKLSILRSPAQRHPYYWAGFIQSGDWTRLRLN